MSNKNLPLWVGRSYLILTIIATIFLAYLKLANEINISWWWVTVPIWGNFLIAFAVLGLCYIIVRIGAKKIAENEK